MDKRKLMMVGALAIAGLGVLWLLRPSSSAAALPSSSSPLDVGLLDGALSAFSGASSSSPYQAVMANTAPEPTPAPTSTSSAPVFGPNEGSNRLTD